MARNKSSNRLQFVNIVADYFSKEDAEQRRLVPANATRYQWQHNRPQIEISSNEGKDQEGALDDLCSINITEQPDGLVPWPSGHELTTLSTLENGYVDFLSSHVVQIDPAAVDAEETPPYIFEAQNTLMMQICLLLGAGLVDPFHSYPSRLQGLCQSMY